MEKEYMILVQEIAKYEAEGKPELAEEFRKRYLMICEAIALKHMQRKGYNDIPYIGVIPEFKWDNVTEEYNCIYNKL